MFGDDPFEDDEIQWADPAIRKDYEAAVGRLILAHNACDRYLTLIIQCCLHKLGDLPALSQLAQGSFHERLRNFALLKALPIDLRLERIDLAKLEELNRERNVVAHGHFEQDPFSGDYELITNKRRHQDYSTDRLHEIAFELDRFASWLEACVAFYHVSPANMVPVGGN